MKINAICGLVLSACWFTACGLNKPSQAAVEDSTETVAQNGQLSIVQKLKTFDHLPDHVVTQNIDEYLNKVDAVKAYTLKLVQNRH